MAEQGAKLQSVNNELVISIEFLRSKKSAIQAEVQKYAEESQKLKREMDKLSLELNEVEKILFERKASQEKYESLLANAEHAFKTIVQNSETLLQVVKSENPEPPLDNTEADIFC